MAMLTPPMPRFKPMLTQQGPQQVLREAPTAAAPAPGRTPDAIARDRKLAEAMIGQGLDFSPVQHWTQGAARLANELAGMWSDSRLQKEEEAGRAGFQTKLGTYQKSLSDPSVSAADRIAQELALVDDPWASEGAKGFVTAQMTKGHDKPFAGTGYDASASNIIVAGQKDPSLRASPEYALAWANLTQPRVIQDAQGRSVLYTPPPPQGILPPGAPAPQGGGASPRQMPQPQPQGTPTPAPQRAPGSTGSIAPIDGAGGAKPNEQQLKNQGFYVRQKAAEATLQNKDMLSKYLHGSNGFVRELGLDFLQSGQAQAVEQAGDEWINGVLRPDSGAVIGPQEMKQYRKTYIPQWGDKPELLAQKETARKRVAEAIRSGLTPEQAVAADGIVAASPNPTPTNEPPPEAIQELKADPSGADEFDQIFGPGSAAKVLGGQGGPLITVPPDSDAYGFQDISRRHQEMNARHKRMLTR